MDSVRFGRALGFGARQAAKAVVSAVDAATAPNPTARPQTGRAPAASTASTLSPETAAARSTEVVTIPAEPVRQTSARVLPGAGSTAASVRDTGRGLARGTRRFGEAVWGPVVKLSGVLWLELTGVFFGLFAVFALQTVWKDRGGMLKNASNASEHVHFLWACGMAVMFGYFCFSSFLRANRRGRGR